MIGILLKHRYRNGDNKYKGRIRLLYHHVALYDCCPLNPIKSSRNAFNVCNTPASSFTNGIWNMKTPITSITKKTGQYEK